MGFFFFFFTCEETCLSVWPPNASLYSSSTCHYLHYLRVCLARSVSRSFQWSRKTSSCQLAHLMSNCQKTHVSCSIWTVDDLQDNSFVWSHFLWKPCVSQNLCWIWCVLQSWFLAVLYMYILQFWFFHKDVWSVDFLHLTNKVLKSWFFFVLL